MRDLCGLPQPIISEAQSLDLCFLPAALQATPSLARRLAVEMTPDGLAVVLTSMTITRFMPEVILVGGNLMEVFLKNRNPYSSSDSEKE